jgi:hypothetical protein
MDGLIKGSSEDYDFVPGDVTAPQTPDRLVQATFEKFGRLEILVNNAGVALNGDFDKFDDEQLDTKARQWSEVLLSATDMVAEQMPRLVQGTAPSGKLRREIASRWGMNGNVIVAGGVGDNAASAIGTGTVTAGSAFVSLGTSGVLFAANDRYLPNPESAVHCFCHALPDTWHQMGVILSATAALDWFADLIGCTSAELTAPLDNTLAPPARRCFCPIFPVSGRRTMMQPYGAYLSGLPMRATCQR